MTNFGVLQEALYSLHSDTEEYDGLRKFRGQSVSQNGALFRANDPVSGGKSGGKN